MVPGFTGSGANQFGTLLGCSASSSENREVLNFQPDQLHISIHLLRRYASSSSKKMAQSTLDVVSKKRNVEKGKANKVKAKKEKSNTMTKTETKK